MTDTIAHTGPPPAPAGIDELLRVRDLTIDYRRRGRRNAPVSAVRGLNLTGRRGETVGLVGESGSGKSSTAMAVLGLIDATGGVIEYDGQEITHATRAGRRLLARRMQVVFQDPYGSMNPARTVGDTVTEALRYNLGLPAEEIRERLHRALADVGLPTDTAGRYPTAFSGGQRQRLAIARALVMDPEFLVCDEAVSALDLSVQAQVLNLLARLKEQRGLSYLFISHDLAVVRHLSDRIVVLYAGRVVEQGPAARIVEYPGHPYTRALIDAAPVPDPAVQQHRREVRALQHVGAAMAETASTTSLAPAVSQGCDFAPRCPFAEARCRTERPELLDHGGVQAACHRYEEIADGVPTSPSAAAEE
jgi:oligopeptide/dipeptide ABC transporter ATP-binding protein